MTAPLDTTELRQCAADVLEWVDFEPLSKPPYGAIKQLCEAFPALLGAAEDWDRLTAEVARLREFVDAWDSRLASPSVLSAQRLAKARAALEEEK